MDPLSVMASVVGLLAAAGQVTSVLSKVKSSIEDAPRSMDHTISEVKALEISLSAIQKFLLGLSSAPRQRITMIQVDQLLATLTEAVLTFSELEAVVKPLATDSESSMVERFRWCWKEDDVSRIVIRLERHKSSLSLMLNIVQCESDLEAEQSRHVLHNLVSQLLESNQEISRRLHNLEASHDSESILTNCFRNRNTLEGVDITEEITEENSNKGDSRTSGPFSNNFQATAFHYSFEIDLNTSRVYRRTEPYESDVSFTSSNVRTHAWSVFSGMSLSEISVVSALALPLYAYDIPNNEWYNFGEIGLAVPMGGTRYQETINWLAPSNSRSTKSTTLSATPSALEKIPEESQLSRASTAVFFYNTTTQWPDSQTQQLKPIFKKYDSTKKSKSTQENALSPSNLAGSYSSTSTTSAGLRGPSSAESSGHSQMLSTPLLDYKHAANQTTKARAAQQAAKAQRKSSPSIPPASQTPTPQAITSRMGRMVLYKLVVLGDKDVGKRSLTIQLTLRHFVETYGSAVGDSYRRQVIIDGQICVLDVLDTSDLEEYTSLLDQFIGDGEGFLLVYCITKRSSFTRIRRLHHQIKRVTKSLGSTSYGEGSVYAEQDSHPPIMLVGNNCDRVTEREVSTEEGHALALELGCEFVEASAKNCINVEKAFYDVVRQLHRQRTTPAEQSRIANASKQQYMDIPELPPLPEHPPLDHPWK